jgi:hypothetical protein
MTSLKHLKHLLEALKNRIFSLYVVVKPFGQPCFLTIPKPDMFSDTIAILAAIPKPVSKWLSL